MSLSVTGGNAADDGLPFNGWFVGDLPTWLRERAQPSDDALAAVAPRASSIVEVKWGIHAAGLHRPGGWVASSGITTLSVLISGRFEVRFRSAEGEPERIVALHDVGDYVISNRDYEHTWRAIEDSVILSVRWGEDGEW